MNYYFAPLEGITGLTYRNLHHKYFGGIHKYYMPFLSPTQNHCLTKKDQRELPPADSVPYTAIPQVLTKSVSDFLWAAECCGDRGYSEVNLNIGCPSGTVVAKGKGAGMLASPDQLEHFLSEIFTKCPLEISVKTRLGLNAPNEFPKLLTILNQFPIKELIIHPRVRTEFYKGSVHLDQFAYAIENSSHKICYNGDICTQKDVQFIQERFPQISSVMIGRGLVADPGLLCGGTHRETLQAFHHELFETYISMFGSRQNAMARMKEIWSMLITLFDCSDSYGEKIRKCTDYDSFCRLTEEAITQLPILREVKPSWLERSIRCEA